MPSPLARPWEKMGSRSCWIAATPVTYAWPPAGWQDAEPEGENRPAKAHAGPGPRGDHRADVTLLGMTGRRELGRLQGEIQELLADLWQIPRVAGLRQGFRPPTDCFRTEDPP